VKTVIDKLILSPYEVISLIKFSISNKEKLLVTYLHQHCFNVYSTNKIYKKLLDKKFFVYADGFGINLASRVLFNKKYQNFNGSDLNDEIFSYLITNKIKFYIVGGNFSEREIENKLFTFEKFAGYSNGFFDEAGLDEILKKINRAEPEVIILGLGVPKQEIIAEKLSKSVNASLFLCVGNFLEFYFGTMKRIPPKYRNKGFEWIYRLFHEPKRLWKRYIIGIPLFIFRVIKYKSSLKNR
jgi:N-acetylglucosaminyldiphosphoundecaprenol N-acetyl-beta-D-mannosaminyltransferase